jgi:hypothetical protein
MINLCRWKPPPHICTVHCSVFIFYCSLFIHSKWLIIIYKESLLSEKSLDLAASVVKFYAKLKDKEAIITEQLIRSSTSVGANISEANYGQSRADFISKMQIALKEAAESEY